ncbi:MAG: ParB/RepB/Spo0J family partition protein [Dehalococcoidia bacterium]|jgi:ParB family chromosome partitioning protein
MTEITTTISIRKILPNPFQPESRVKVSIETARKFAQSIKTHGLLQTPVVRSTDDDHYEMGDGWLRLAGYRQLAKEEGATWEVIPVIIRELSDRQMADLVMEANSCRNDLNPIDRAHFYSTYLNRFNVTQGEMAKYFGRSQGDIANTIRLLDLPEDAQGLIIGRKITETHGIKLLQLKDKGLMSSYACDAVNNGWSVAELDSHVKNHLNVIKPQPKAPAQSRELYPTEPPPGLIPEGVRQAHEVPDAECSKCNLTATDHTLGHKFLVGNVSFKVCIKDYAKVHPEKPVLTTVPPLDTMQPETREAVTEMATKAAEHFGGLKQENSPKVVHPSQQVSFLKLILTETDDGVMAVIVKKDEDGDTITEQYQRTFKGNLDNVILQGGMLALIADAEQWWDKKEQKRQLASGDEVTNRDFKLSGN